MPSIRWVVPTLTVVAIGAAWPTEALASTRDFYNYCTPGAFRACASVEVSLVPGPPEIYGPTTLLMVRLRNLQGIPGRGTTPWSLSGLTFSGLRGESSIINSDRLARPQAVDGAEKVLKPDVPGCPLSEFPDGCGNLAEAYQLSPTSTDALRVYLYDDFWNYFGCDVPPSPDAAFGYYRTCGEGWVTVQFSLSGTWEFTEQTQFGFNGRTMDGQQFGCGYLTLADCQVVPEPITIILLGTGLAGMGGVGALRRRRKREAES